MGCTHVSSQDLDVSPWCSSSSVTLPVTAVMALLKAESAITDVVHALIGVHSSFVRKESATPASTEVIAKNISTLRELLLSAQRVVQVGSSSYSEAPLVCTAAAMKQWLAVGVVYADCVQAQVLSETAARVRKASSSVEAVCPRWGEVVSDTVFDLLAATVMFCMDPSISTLPALCRNLSVAMTSLSRVGIELKLPQLVKEYASTRDIVRSACNSLEFGKKTVNVGAAIKVLTAKPFNAASAAAILKLKETLPGSLVTHLEGALNQSKVGPLASADAAGASDGDMKRAAATESATAAKVVAKRAKKEFLR